MNITQFSIRRPIFTIVVMAMLVILSVVSLTRLPVQLMPNIDPPIAVVATSYPGASPDEIVQTVTEPLEEDLSSVTGLNNLQSQTQEGTSLIILEFNFDMTISDIELEVRDILDTAELPEGANDPAFIEFDITMFPSLQMAVNSELSDNLQIENDLTEITRQLERIEGVASLTISGLETREVLVELDTAELQNYGLSQQDISDIISSKNLSVPAGTIVDEEEGYTITTRTTADIESIEELREIVLFEMPDEEGDVTTVTLDDVAEVTFNSESDEIITRLNQVDALQLDMMLEDGANAALVNSEFRSELDELLDDERYNHFDYAVLYDEGQYITDSIDSVYVALISGAGLAMLVLFLFLRNVRAPLIVGFAIPFSILTTFALFYFVDFSINMMTLGGLALGIGMLIDNSVIVIENIYRHMSMGKPRMQAAKDGTKEITSAVIAATLTTASVFLPVVFVTGIISQLFVPLALAIVFSLFSSLFVALTIVPMLASRFLKVPKGMSEAARKESTQMSALRKMTRFTLRHRFLVLVFAVLVFVAGIWGVFNQGMEFMPESDEGVFIVTVEKEQGVLLNETFETVQGIEEIVKENENVDSYLSTIGGNPMMGFGTESNVGQIMVTLVPFDDRDVSTFDVIDALEEDIIESDTSADIAVSPMMEAGLGEPNTLAFTLTDDNRERLNETEEELTDLILEEDETFYSVESSADGENSELQIIIDEDEAMEQGFVPAQVAMQLFNASNGITATTMEHDGEFLTINVKYPESILDSEENFGNILIPNNEGEYVALANIASFEEVETEPMILRDSLSEARSITVWYDSDMVLNDAYTELNNLLEDYEFHDDTTYNVGGNVELLLDALPQIALLLILGVVFTYLVMAAQFESLRAPIAILMTIPLAFIGVALALIITQNALSVIAMVGAVLLIGIVVNNAILLVDFILQQKAKGMDTYEAIEVSVQNRFRPILITAITTIMGMLPIALGLGEGQEMVAPMGIVVIGGLATSTLLTLFIIPIVYSYLDKETRDINKKYMTTDGQLISKREFLRLKKEQENNGSEYGYPNE